VWADPGGGEPPGGEQLPRELAHLVSLHRLETADDLLHREERRAGHHPFAKARHAVRRRLEREQQAPLEVLLRACELLPPHVAASEVDELGYGDLETRGEVLLAGADVEPDLARI